MDGNFGLVRKKNAGASPMPPDHDGIYFVKNEEVEQFCSNYYEEKEKDKVKEFVNLSLRYCYGLEQIGKSVHYCHYTASFNVQYTHIISCCFYSL
jgi:hypothetical protein